MLTLVTITIQASVAVAGTTKMAVITRLAPLTTQAWILIGRKCDDILRKARRTGLAKKPPFDIGASLGIEKG